MSVTTRRRLVQLAGAAGVATVVLVGAIALGSSGGRTAAATPSRTASVNALLAGIPQHGATLGRADAPLTLVEFADLKCPVCRQYSADVLPTLITRYVRAGKLKIVYRPQHFVGEQLNPGDSLAAARFAEAAGRQNRLWNFTELFYAGQQDESTRYVTDAYLRKLAGGAPGLDTARAFADRSSPAVTRALRQSSSAFSANGFTGTPSFLVGPTNGQLQPLATPTLAPGEFTSAIDALLAR